MRNSAICTHTKYRPGDKKSKRIRWERHITRTADRRVVYRLLLENREGKRPLGRPTYKWENIRNDKFNIIPKTAHTVTPPDDEWNNYSRHVEEFIKIKSISASRWLYYIIYNIRIYFQEMEWGHGRD